MGGAAGIQNAGGSGITENDGTILAQNYGIYIAGGRNVTINRGEIDAQSGIVDLNASGDLVENFGIVTGSGYSLALDGGSNATVKNWGTLDGNVQFDCSDTTFANRGVIDGNVQFGAGTNFYNGRVGALTGTITGGSGNDTFHLGADGETADGGAGKNVIYGGAGADTFIYSALGAGDATNIIGFSVAMDTIALESAVFTKLIAGATPKFAIATAATGPHDYLFYNSATGGLYYDADGSGKGAAVLLGDVGAGLRLTANNFTIV